MRAVKLNGQYISTSRVGDESEYDAELCPYDYLCLIGDEGIVSSAGDAKGKHVKLKTCVCDKKYCNYLMSYGSSYLSHSPVKTRIYLNYNI